ncbi:C39 family peptidase [Mycobacterium colombiense]|uniref:C39 family peptidase n=1 Tax=Mycobacterium colombiense TaxID=339268 RepID=UPI000801E7E1|nr:C39 family peptidase [Mycobacterium colombiense]OBJ19865.1 hypothetical protein A9W93_16715 [Mycobacterium colombiense]
MLTFRSAPAARAAVIGACIGLAATLVSGCGGAPPATTAATTSLTTVVAAQTNSSPAPGTGPAAATAPGMYGNPAAAAKYWVAQSLEDNCGLVSIADVVGEVTGNAPTERQMLDLAESTPSGANPGPIYAPRNDSSHSGPDAGISMSDLVILLDHFGIKSEMTSTSGRDQNGLPLLEQYLAKDRKIIAFVNSSVILNADDQRTKGDHFLVVTGIDTAKEIVHLNDPGIDHADEQVSFGTFMTAWQTSDQSIVVTAAPG